MSTFAATTTSFDHGADADGAHGTRRASGRRGLDALEVLILVVIAVLLLVGVAVTRSPGANAVHSTSVRVERGQSLWDLAKSHPVDGMTTAQTAELIARLNDLGTRSLVTNTVVRVPVNESSDAFASR